MKGTSVDMKTRNATSAIATAIALGFSLILSGCATADKVDKPKPSPTVTIPAPLTVDLATYDGKNLDLPMNRVIAIFNNGKAAKGISGSASDATLVQYVDAYSADAGKTFAPGILPVAKGTVTVTIKGADLDKPVDLKVTVVAPLTK
jgi:hypothetical protein